MVETLCSHLVPKNKIAKEQKFLDSYLEEIKCKLRITPIFFFIALRIESDIENGWAR